jgi:hypothetical protein
MNIATLLFCFTLGFLARKAYDRYRVYQTKKRFLRIKVAIETLNHIANKCEIYSNIEKFNPNEPQNAVDSLLNEMNIKKEGE